ncbi:MAG: hypothetical protein U9Q77_02505 [Candidatus Marinimicrobia bacterium]|nr:hypothetical protein [Candidatus Neomarinimicrobiota bacterium]
MSIALLLTGENKVHASCSATNHLDGEDGSCAFCPNDEDEDQITTLSKAGYLGRKDIVSQEVFDGREDRNIVVERLKYNTGRD